MASFRTLDDIGDIAGKRVLVREDLNVPMDGGKVTDDTRLRAAVPTVAELQADAERFFTTLDGNRDGEIDPDEMTRYEREVAPEIQLGSLQLLDSGGALTARQRQAAGGGLSVSRPPGRVCVIPSPVAFSATSR